MDKVPGCDLGHRDGLLQRLQGSKDIRPRRSGTNERGELGVKSGKGFYTYPNPLPETGFLETLLSSHDKREAVEGRSPAAAHRVPFCLWVMRVIAVANQEGR